MKRFLFSMVVAVVAIGAASSVLRSHVLSPSRQTGMPSVEALQTQRSGTLPDQEIEDRSVVFAKERTQ
ncbi:hypothetical protein RAD16_27135 [Bradyrhizobium sp. 18BD]